MVKNRGKRILAFAFFLGLFFGVLYTNLFADTYSMTNGIFSPYFLSEYASLQIDKSEFLFYLAEIRIIPVMILMFFAALNMKKTGAILFVIWFGFLTGVLFVTSIMQLGIRGILISLLAMLPQLVFYMFSYSVVLWTLYAWPRVNWNLTKIVFVVILICMGILTEVYVNPVILKWCVKYLFKF